ncbi:uncharacterized protein [Choristoneura fumiferana]|uniref:uncharacterized protein n=1 Tax=Choristoneura fumiferana TaxID=7141 RepID=UPI003D157250
MKIFLFICLAVGWASADKLDRSYLPPPGSKFSGGSPGDIQVPLEFPKLNYSTGRPQVANGVPEIELGINRRPLPAGTAQSSTQRPDGSTYFPKTTTSYAITQTTTFGPADYEELDQSSNFFNATGAQQTGLPQYTQQSGQNYQQRQPIRGPLPSQGPNYNQYQQGQKFQPISAPYGSTTRRPSVFNNQNSRAYLPPAPTSIYKGQTPTGQLSNEQEYFGYPPGQPQGPKYQDGSKFAPTAGPGFIEGANKQNVFFGNPSTVAPQYQDERYSSTTGPINNQQKFGSRVPTQQNQQQFQETPGYPTSTFSPGQLSTSNGQTVYDDQNIPSSASLPQYQYGQRIITPELNQQVIGSRLPQQNQNKYSGNTNFPSTTATPQYQEEQQFVTPGLVQQNQFADNQNVPSTVLPQYQENQRYTTPGTIQEGFIPNQQTFGPQISNLNTQNKYGNQNLPSSTAVLQSQNGQRFTTPKAVQQQQQNQFSANQNSPLSTPAPQYKNEQRYPTQGSAEQIGSIAPGQQNQYQYPGNQFFPSTTTPQRGIGSPAYTQQNENQYQGNQNVPSSTTRPQFQNGQFVTPGFVQQYQYPGNQIISSTASPQIQNAQSFIPGPGQGIGSNTSNQVNYPESETIVENGNQQYPSSAAPQYQSTLSPIAEPNQGFTPNQPTPQYPGRPAFNQQFPSTTASPGFPQQQYGDDSIQTLPGTRVSYPSTPGTSSKQVSPGYRNQPLSPTDSQIYGSTPIVPGYYDQPITNLVPGSIDSTGTLRQNRPERPNAALDRTATILNYDNVLTPEGYMYSYDTSNAIHVDETGIVGDGTKAQGSFSYIGDDGKMYSVIYSADENGFQPKGDHLPTPPPIPEAIQRVIEQANKNKESGIEDDGLYDEEKYGYSKYDRPVSAFRPRNNTTSLVNGADIPNSYESRIGQKNRNQLKNKGKNKSADEENDNTGFEDELQTDVNISDEINNDNDESLLNKYPTADEDLTNVSDPRKIQKGKLNSNANVDSMKTRKPVAGKGTIRHPVSIKMKQDNAFGNVSVTDISKDNDDMEISQEYEEESDLVNYRDDPNSRTDFHGINRYLPNPKGSNRFNQTDSKRVLVRPDGTKQKVKAMNKSDRTGNRKNQATEDVIPTTGSETKEQTRDEDRIAVPARSKFSMKKIESSKMYQQKPTYNNDKSKIFVDEEQKVNEKYASDDELETGDGDISTQPGVYEFNKKIVGKPTRLNVNERTGVSKDNNVKPIFDEETGYEYIPPQRKFESEGAVRLPSRTSATGKPQFPSQGVQTTIRPFITSNVYKTEKNDDSQFDAEGKPFQPGRPINYKVQKNNESLQGNDRSSENSYPGINENGRFDVTIKPIGSFSTTSSRRPFGRPQTTAMPGYKAQDTTGQERYDELDYQGPRAPGKIIYGVNAPNKEASRTESNAFVSTTPLPSSGYQSFNDNQRPDQYQETNIANDPSYFEITEPGKDVQNTPYRQGIANSRGQIPSTTFRPSYTVGDKTLASSGPIAVDGFGRPISGTNAPIYETTYRPVTQDSRISIENQPGNMGERRPSGRFSVTSAPTEGINGYQGSTSGPSEDFSGPKQPQRFDPDTGYYY